MRAYSFMCPAVSFQHWESLFLWSRLWRALAAKAQVNFPSELYSDSDKLALSLFPLVPTALPPQSFKTQPTIPWELDISLWFDWPRTCWVSTAPKLCPELPPINMPGSQELTNYLAECSHKHRFPTCILADQGACPCHCCVTVSNEP